VSRSDTCDICGTDEQEINLVVSPEHAHHGKWTCADCCGLNGPSRRAAAALRAEIENVSAAIARKPVESSSPTSSTSKEHAGSSTTNVNPPLEASSFPDPSPSPGPGNTPLESDQEAEVDWLLSQHAAGEISPVAVIHRDLPAHATDTMRLVAVFFALVCGLRYVVDDERPVPFACAWVKAHLGLAHKMTAHRARRSLVEVGVLSHAGRMPGRGGKTGTDLYVPFERAPVFVEVGDGVPVQPIAEVPAEHVVVTAETFVG
jgi:hypothetical protein